MNEQDTIRTVLFELDDVLVDPAASVYRTILDAVNYFTGRELSASALYARLREGTFPDRITLVHELVHEAGMVVSHPRVTGDFLRRFRGEGMSGLIVRDAPLVSGSLLGTLARGRVLGIVTRRPMAEARFVLERFAWRQHVPLVVAGEQQERHLPPDGHGLRRALLMLREVGIRTTPRTAAFVSATAADVSAARENGFWAVGVVPPCAPDAAAHEAFLLDHGAHAVVHHLDALSATLNALVAPEKSEREPAAA